MRLRHLLSAAPCGREADNKHGVCDGQASGVFFFSCSKGSHWFSKVIRKLRRSKLLRKCVFRVVLFFAVFTRGVPGIGTRWECQLGDFTLRQSWARRATAVGPMWLFPFGGSVGCSAGRHALVQMSRGTAGAHRRIRGMERCGFGGLQLSPSP